jgi:hypothetical protein
MASTPALAAALGAVKADPVMVGVDTVLITLPLRPSAIQRLPAAIAQ